MKKPVYHYRPHQHWINDPNGLVQLDGTYHLFFQHNPGGPMWGDMHWGHATSPDMMRWDTRPIAMAPALDKGEIHCFSGSCCVGHDGEPRIYYTSVGRAEEKRDARHGAQQWMAHFSPDRLTLMQTDVFALRDPQIEGGLPILEWRDPHVIRWQDGYLMALGGLADGYGCVAAYTSANGYDWTYRGLMLRSDVQDDVTWECPNLFAFGDRLGILYSPCGAVRYAVGMLGDNYALQVTHDGLIDPAGWQGFYAPQTFRDERGRQILLGWMPECDGEQAALAKGWSGCMSLPREMYLNEDGDLRIRLLAEAGAIAETWRDIQVEQGSHCLTKQGRQCYVKLTGCITAPVTLTLITNTDGSEYARLTITPDGTLMLDRSCSCSGKTPDTAPICRTAPVREGCINLFAAFDESTIECSVNDVWLSGRVYPTGAAGVMMLQCQDALRAEICDQLAQVNQRF